MNTEILNHWGEYFLNFAWPMLWQSSLLIGVIFILDFALRRKVRAAIRHALWLVVLVKLLLPPTLALPTSPNWWVHSSAPPPAKAPPVSFTVTYGDQVMPDFPAAPAPIIPPKPPVLKLAAWVMILSCIVNAGLLAWLLIRWRGVLRKIRNASETKGLDAMLNESARLAGLRSAVRLKLREDSMSPAVCGLFRPVILLPKSLVERLSAGQLRAVLLHEAIHLRRGDVWVNCAQALLQIIYWWHPLLWLANARIRRVREEAVDDAVMLALRDDAEIYAPTLLEVAKFAFRRPLASLGLVGILESRSALRQRIERLVDFDAPRKAGLTVVSIFGILAFSAVALPMGEAPEKTNAPTPVSQSNNTAPTATNGVEGKLDANNLVQVAKLLYEMGRFDDAETKLKSALAFDPGNQAAHYYLNLVRESRMPPGSYVPRISTDFAGIHTSSGREAILHKLNTILLDKTPDEWANGIPLSEVIRYLAEQSRLRDPDKTGIHFLFNPNVATGAAAGAPNLINPTTGLPEKSASGAAPKTVDPNTINVKLVMKDASLHDVLEAALLVANRPIKYSIEDYGVVISPKPLGPEPPMLEMRVFRVDTNEVLPNLQKVMKLPANASTVTILQNCLTNLFPANGMDYQSPPRTWAYNDRLGLLFVKATPLELDELETIIIQLNSPAFTGFVENSNSSESLTSLEQRKRVEPIASKVSYTNMEMRVFKIDTNAFLAAVRDYTNMNASDAAKFPDLLKFFSAVGVDLTAPGRSIAYGDKLGLLFVKATPSELDTIERVVQVLNQVTPQIHIKARFIEVPKNGFVMPQTLTNIASNLMIGILSSEQTKILLQSLREKPGVETLAEPEVTTIGGRQTQMRATGFAMVVTNFAFQETPSNSTAIVPQAGTFEIGPTVDVVPRVLDDDFTIDLTTIVTKLEFIGYEQSTNVVFATNNIGKRIQLPTVSPGFRVQKAEANVYLWDNQTLVLGNLKSTFFGFYGGKEVTTESKWFADAEKKSSDVDKQLLVFVTATIIDPAGNRIHSDNEFPNLPAIPPQPR